MGLEIAPMYCGGCPQFSVNQKATHHGWEGKCTPLGLGRHADTPACTNPQLWAGKEASS